MKSSDLSDIIGKLMNDPQAVEMVRKLRESNTANDTVSADRVGTSAENKRADTPNADLKNAADSIPGLMDLLSPLLKNQRQGEGNLSEETKRRESLLRALKPYLSRERQELIETALSLSRLTGLSDILSVFKNDGQGGDR